VQGCCGCTRAKSQRCATVTNTGSDVDIFLSKLIPTGDDSESPIEVDLIAHDPRLRRLHQPVCDLGPNGGKHLSSHEQSQMPAGRDRALNGAICADQILGCKHLLGNDHVVIATGEQEYGAADAGQIDAVA
jgi:hypothetical protein